MCNKQNTPRPPHNAANNLSLQHKTTIMTKIAIAIHGGAGTLVRGMMTAEKETAYRRALSEARDAGYALLRSGKSALDAVEGAVRVLEDSPLFNAGKGSVFTADGTHEMDASIMCGDTREAGAVALIRGIANPVSLARDVMQHSHHVFLAGEGAMQFARKMGYTLEDEAYFYDDLRFRQWQDIKDTDGTQLDHAPKDHKFGTVGAVALDLSGNTAAATSTGGMTNKRYGRIGDSPVIGAGTYADNATCAVSCTGSGEYFIRGVAAYDVAAIMRYTGATLEIAATRVIQDHLIHLQGDGGLIAIDRLGNIAMPFNTEGMYRAMKDSSGYEMVGIYGT